MVPPFWWFPSAFSCYPLRTDSFPFLYTPFLELSSLLFDASLLCLLSFVADVWPPPPFSEDFTGPPSTPRNFPPPRTFLPHLSASVFPRAEPTPLRLTGLVFHTLHDLALIFMPLTANQVANINFLPPSMSSLSLFGMPTGS